VIRPLATIVAASLLVGPLLAAELGTRALIRSGRLPEAPSSNPETDVSLANVARFGQPDVLVLGTSGVRSGLRPSVLEELIAEATGATVTVRSVAQPALSLEGHRLIVRGLARRALIPRLVILGLTPSTMTGYGPAGDWFPRSELGRLWAGCEGLAGWEGLSCALGQHSALWRWRRDTDAVRRALRDKAPRTREGDKDRQLTPSGWLSERPVGSYTLEERVPRLLEVLPSGVPLPTENVAAFAALVSELRAAGATVVAVALPYAPQLGEALVARNPGWKAERDAGYAALGSAADLSIVAVERFGEWWTDRAQNDLRHLSRVGAGPMTRQLWSMPEFRLPVLAALASDGEGPASDGG
jgi:hypothetical protein